MDAYLDESFQTYKGVSELIEWLLSRDILFMINTTGTQGYFQRVFAKGLLPEAPIVAANPMIRFEDPRQETRYEYQVIEIEDKPKNTAAVISALEVPENRLVVMGDSGGDGPHFQWAFRPTSISYRQHDQEFIGPILPIKGHTYRPVLRDFLWAGRGSKT